MSTARPPLRARPDVPMAERLLELWLYRSRWLLAPIYVGLVVALGALVVVFVEEVVEALASLVHLNPREAIIASLSMVDLSLTANLMVIVIFSGYENFVAKMDIDENGKGPTWMGAIDFTGLKVKLIASIIAISTVALLRAFVRMAEGDLEISEHVLFLLVGLHLVFLASGVLLALMDLIASQAEKSKH
jgi:uncharacterized protein (TIGR00645 family)